ncbi:DAZ-associated protein 1 [Branchiostoma belcheri]|nr:DAZ-associated protein 1 [Branchiostoma belcheri]
MANSQGDEVGKLFVGGISWDTTQEGLKNYFSKFGEVVDCVIMKDSNTGRSRGFGFVKFQDASCVQTVLASGPHNLDGRVIDPKECTPRSQQRDDDGGWGGRKRFNQGKAGGAYQGRVKKIFVGGIPPNCGEEDLKEFFGTFGKVTEVVMMYDQQKQRPRGQMGSYPQQESSYGAVRGSANYGGTGDANYGGSAGTELSEAGGTYGGDMSGGYTAQQPGGYTQPDSQGGYGGGQMTGGYGRGSASNSSGFHPYRR